MERAFFGGAVACALVIFAGEAPADDLLRLWGIDNDDAQLFAIDDVRNPAATMVDYGRIHVANGFEHDVVEGDIHAFTIVNTFDAFFVAQDGVGSHPGPVLLHIDLHDIGVSGDAGQEESPGVITAEVIGSLLDAGWDPSWTVTGIAGDPLYNEMYILGADGDPTTNDRISRIHATIDREVEIEPIGEIRWRFGGVTMGGDMTLGPAGLLMISDEAEGRIVMVEPASGEVKGVRLEGVRVDTDTALYGGIAWDGYNDRTAMFDRRTKQLIVDNRLDNSIVAFDLLGSGVGDVAGMEFVFRPTPPDQSAPASSSSRARGVNNFTRRDSYGRPKGASPSGGGGGGGQNSLNPFDPSLLPEDPLDPPVDLPADDPLPPSPPGDDLPDDEFDDPPGDDPPEGPPPPPDGPPDGPPDIPAPGGIAVLGLGASALIRRRRGRDGT